MLNIYKNFIYSLSGCFLLLTTGCGTTSAGYTLKKTEPPASISVAVKKFSIEPEKDATEADMTIREFESFLLPALLAEAIQTDPEIHEALFVDSPSYALDYVFEGHILKSNGRDLHLEYSMTRVDGERVLKGKIKLKHPEEEPHDEMAELSRIYEEILDEIKKVRRKTKVDLSEARAFAYAGTPDLSLNPEVMHASEEAGKVETEVILIPLSSAVTERALIAAEVYFHWQDLSKGLVYEQGRASRGKWISGVTSGLMAVTSAVSLAAGYEAASQGNTQMVQMAQQNSQLANSAMMQHAAYFDIESNRLENIQFSLDQYKQTFGSQGAEPVTVEIYGKVMELKGSQENKLQEFHDLVSQVLIEKGNPLPGPETGEVLQ